MEIIRSNKNEKVKEWLKLKTAKGRKQFQAYLLEGIHSIEEAIQAQAQIETLLIMEDKQTQLPAAFMFYPYRLLAPSVFERLAQTQTSQGVIAIVKIPPQTEELQNEGKFLLIDAVQDPGNLGTIIRTADAAGFSAVLLGTGTVDLYNDKVLRSMQGSQFHIPIRQVELSSWLEQFPYPVFVSALTKQACDYRIIEKEPYLALIVGNEGNGVQKELIDRANYTVTIPMLGKAESLNVAVATGILLYATVDQTNSKERGI